MIKVDQFWKYTKNFRSIYFKTVNSICKLYLNKAILKSKIGKYDCVYIIINLVYIHFVFYGKVSTFSVRNHLFSNPHFIHEDIKAWWYKLFYLRTNNPYFIRIYTKWKMILNNIRHFQVIIDLGRRTQRKLVAN